MNERRRLVEQCGESYRKLKSWCPVSRGKPLISFKNWESKPLLLELPGFLVFFFNQMPKNVGGFWEIFLFKKISNQVRVLENTPDATSPVSNSRAWELRKGSSRSRVWGGSKLKHGPIVPASSSGGLCWEACPRSDCPGCCPPVLSRSLLSWKGKIVMPEPSVAGSLSSKSQD